MAMFPKDEDRKFETIWKERTDAGVLFIMMEKETRIQYLLAFSSTGCSITPLLDENGKPRIAENNM